MLIGFWQVKNQERDNFMLYASSNCPAPFSERTHPEITVMLSPDQVPAKISAMNHIRHQFPRACPDLPGMSNAITPELVCHDLPGFASMRS